MRSQIRRRLKTLHSALNNLETSMLAHPSWRQYHWSNLAGKQDHTWNRPHHSLNGVSGSAIESSWLNDGDNSGGSVQSVSHTTTRQRKMVYSYIEGCSIRRVRIDRKMIASQCCVPKRGYQETFYTLWRLRSTGNSTVLFYLQETIKMSWDRLWEKWRVIMWLR